MNCQKAVEYFADIEKSKLFQLLKRKWNILKEMTYILKIPYDATISLQKQTLTLSDVFGIWLIMQLHLEACVAKNHYQTNLAKHLLSTLNERKETIFKNPFMSSALFLDPRYRGQIVRNEDKIRQAKATLTNIWRRLIYINAPIDCEEVNQSSNHANTSDTSISFEYDKQAALDRFLGGSPQNESIVSSQLEEDIECLLDTFDPPRMKSNMSVLQYWEEKKLENEALYKLAMVVYSIPPTEVQIERDFSKLNFVFSDRRCRLTQERLEDIMIINLNDELFNEVKEEQLTELTSL